MSGEDNNFSVWGFIKGFGKLLIGFLLLIQGLVGLVVMLMIVGVLVAVSSGFAGGKSGAPTVPKDVALLLNPNGVLVEQAESSDPFEQAIQDAYGASEPGQIEVGDLIRAVREAKTDERIKGLVLDLGELYVPSSSASKLHDLAAELDRFKESGKPVVAIGDSYTQEQYLLASRADTVMMHDMGSIVLTGYGSYGTYLKSLLDKLLVTPHVFRVGTFKAAVEPFLRDDMSPEAKEANMAYLTVLWNAYVRSVEAARGFEPGAVEAFANDYNARLLAAGGDMAKAALNADLVDTLKSRADQTAFLKETFGEDEDSDSFKNVGYARYLAALEPVKDGEAPNVAIVTAAGTIVDGEADPGVAAGGDTVAALLRDAREDDDVKAVVLRVDSPGGSAFASEIIRDEVIALKAAGKPVVVSMGSLAASGGYWIAAPGDEIWASPTTITGSIGIFGFFPTFEKAAQYWGVTIDGVGTTKLSNIEAVGLGPLDENLADIFQQSIEHGYREFIGVVAEGRSLTTDYVDSVGQGRVWIGETAKELKLVDNLGGLDEAVAAAARLAKLETYDRVELREEEMSPFTRILSELGAKAFVRFGVSRTGAMDGAALLNRVAKGVEKHVVFLDQFNDPKAVYARCLACEM